MSPVKYILSHSSTLLDWLLLEVALIPINRTVSVACFSFCHKLKYLYASSVTSFLCHFVGS